MDSVTLNNYKLAGKICKSVINILKREILENNQNNVLQLSNLGNKLLIEEYKKTKNKENVQIAFPTCISLNNCVGHYIFEKDNKEFNFIKQDDLVKIELGLNINGSINITGDSFFVNKENKEHLEIFKMLNKLENKITKLANVNSTNDDIKMLIESYCTNYDCFPVENTISYQHLLEHIQTDESKYIITNFEKYYDKDDNLMIPQDICFDLEENDVFTINLTIIPNNNKEKHHIYHEKHSSHIYKYNEYYHNFKLQSSKEFYSNIKKNHGFNVFSMIDYQNNVKNRIGLKESLENGILNTYPILYNKEKIPVFFRKFTLIVGKEKGINLQNCDF
jgi:methionine aminopeptidase